MQLLSDVIKERDRRLIEEACYPAAAAAAADLATQPSNYTSTAGVHNRGGFRIHWDWEWAIEKYRIPTATARAIRVYQLRGSDSYQGLAVCLPAHQRLDLAQPPLGGPQETNLDLAK